MSTPNTPALASTPTGTVSVFSSESSFDAAQRMAKALAASSMVPKEYQGNIANCIIALELSSRIGATAFAVMQNLHIIQGRPSFSASFVIATVNACGRFTPLRFEEVGEGDSYGVRAVAHDKATGEVLIGDLVTWTMVKAEGWSSKSGSKWRTMPGQMFRYRAATFWARVFAPELMMGLGTSDESEDIAAVVRTEMAAHAATPVPAIDAPRSGLAGLDAVLDATPVDAEVE
jgi:hypothetical protein